MKYNYNTKVLFLTVTFPQKSGLEEEWRHTKGFIENFKRFALKQLLVVGGILAVEAHKNSTLKSQKGKNTKAGRPLLHMQIWLANQSLNPHIHKLQLMLELGGTVARIKQLKTPAEVLKTALHVTKEGGDPDLRTVVQRSLGWGSNVNVWINQKGVEKPFQTIAEKISPVSCSKGFYMSFPTTRKHKDKSLIVAELCFKPFTGLGLAVRDDYVCRKTEGSRFS